MDFGRLQPDASRADGGELPISAGCLRKRTDFVLSIYGPPVIGLEDEPH